MNKNNMHARMNRNNSQFHANGDRVCKQNVMEIMELDSNDTDSDSNEEQDIRFGQVWNHLDKYRFRKPVQDFYRPNERARERHRVSANNYDDDSSPDYDYSENSNLVFSHFFDPPKISDKHNRYNNYNCFTIFNKPFLSPESSSDEIEMIDHHDNIHNHDGNDGRSEILTFDKDLDFTKRTVWIYSFKNKRHLTENDFELVNIPSQDSDSSTSCTFDNFDEEHINIKNSCRVSSPIPTTYVPRLNLSLATTLPTVTEISEPIKSENRTSTLKNLNTGQRSVNNWLDSKLITANGDSKEIKKEEQKISTGTNVINWMCLSPRERRHRFKHTNLSPTFQPQLPVLVEVPSSEPNSQESHTSYVMQTTAEVNVAKNCSTNIHNKVPSKCQIELKNNDDSIIVTDMDTEDNEIVGINNRELGQKPQMVLDPIPVRNTGITDPIEKLNSNHWILEKTKNGKLKSPDTNQPEITDYINDESNTDVFETPVSRKLWARHMSLLKPVQWTEFQPITDSIPSLHISIDSDSEKQSWFKRLVTCFRCFK